MNRMAMAQDDNINRGWRARNYWLASVLWIIWLLAGCQQSQRFDNPDLTTPPVIQNEATEPLIEVGLTPTTVTEVMTPTTRVEQTVEPSSSINADADIEFVRAVLASDGSWTFHVTVRHPDTGWEDYADGWDIVTANGTVLKSNDDDPFTRLLLHPHENEQPFTRSQSGIRVPEGVSKVTVRAHDIVDGFGGREVDVDLIKESGPDFQVER
jgi:hypothetical protein